MDIHEDVHENYITGETEVIFENDDFKQVSDQIKIETNTIHKDCEDEMVDFSKNWRDSARHFQTSADIEKPKLDFSRFFSNDWKNAKVAAKQLKFCPGEYCRQWLPLFQFGENDSMNDKLDVYCISCNQRSRRIKRKKIDKFEAFVAALNKDEDEQQYINNVNNVNNMNNINNIEREVDRRIMQAAKEAQRRYNRKFFVDKADITRKLFQHKKFVCCITGSVLTQQCFLDHHTLTFQLSNGKDKIEIVCSQCRICTPPRKTLNDLCSNLTRSFQNI